MCVYVTVSCQDPKFSNGRIKRFELKIEFVKASLRNGSAEWERIPVNKSAPDGGPGHNILKKLLLPDNKSINVSVIAINSVGASPMASLIIPDKMSGRRFSLNSACCCAPEAGAYSPDLAVGVKNARLTLNTSDLCLHVLC